jgi:hypothetical protein
MQKTLLFPSYRLSWSFRQTRSTARRSHFRQIHLNCPMNMQPR